MLEALYRPDVQPPQLVPGGDGSVQVEWHCHGWDIELDVLDIQNVVASRERFDSDDEPEEQVLQSDFAIVTRWLDQLTSDTAVSERQRVAL